GGATFPGDNFTITAANNSIRGLAITGALAGAGRGILVTGGAAATNVVVTGNRIGVELTGLARGNIRGILVDFGVPGTRIGGAIPAERNIISGNFFDGIFLNGTNSLVIGNFIGTNAAGNAALGNFRGINVNNGCAGCTIQQNVISGNNGVDARGIELRGPNSIVIGNFIGTDATGNFFVGNTTGIEVGPDTCTNCRVGGTTAAERNVISGNSTGITFFSSQNARIIGNFIGTNVTGTVPLGNTIGVSVEVTCNNCVIGGAGAREGNLISGNTFRGIILEGPGSQVIGNFIGTDVTGSFAIGNLSGVYFEENCNQCVVGGTTAATRNLISGNVAGIELDGFNARAIGNFVGTNVTGTQDVGNGVGIRVLEDCANCTIGGVAAGERNVISGNDEDGIQLNFDSSFADIFGNFIGTDSSGVNPLGNSGAGIRVNGDDHAIGNRLNPTASNVIAFNGGGGVVVVGSIRNIISVNSIFNNQGLGIDLGGDGVTLNDPADVDTGPNQLLNFPEFDAISFAITGGTATVTGRAPAGSIVEIFLSALDPSGHGEGRTFLTAVTATATGTFSAILAGRADRELITAVAIDSLGNTSEFSQNAMLGFGRVEWGLTSDIPVTGDYNGDGAADFAVVRPNDPAALIPGASQWYILNFFFGFRIQLWGLPGDVPVPADYDGDGITDIAVWRPIEGNWYLLPSTLAGGFSVQQWGLLGDIPVPEDYDGDGRDDLAVWRPSTGGWFVILTGGGFIFDVRFGQNGDT
ncbi:MAG: hypothetical protein L0Y56_11565, partial [Nitrospira sp.]|nr:hypothetical protein [Nitrospira sp.]